MLACVSIFACVCVCVLSAAVKPDRSTRASKRGRARGSREGEEEKCSVAVPVFPCDRNGEKGRESKREGGLPGLFKCLE